MSVIRLADRHAGLGDCLTGQGTSPIRRWSAKMRWLPIAGAVAIAVLGGVFFGLFSCGGYAWHKEAFFWLLVAAVAIATLFPLQRGLPVLWRVVIVLGVPVLFLAVRAATAPFYPVPPTSWSEFLQVFISTFEHGPC